MTRLIVPDLARGAALLGIATANVSQAWLINDWSSPESGPGYTLGGVRPDSTADQFFAVFSAMFIHSRGLPMFATLLGFGFGLVAASLYRKHYPLKDARRVLIRRYAALAIFGLAHMFLIFYGDIMLMYGLIGVVMALMFTLTTRTLRIIAYAILAITTLFTLMGAVTAMVMDIGAFQISMTDETGTMASISTYLLENLQAALLMLASTPFAVIQLGTLSLIGYCWAQDGILVNPGQHKRTLITWTAIAAAIVLLVGLPWGLSAIGVLDPSLEQGLYLANTALGMWTGPGILAALTLLTAGLNNRRPAWAYPLVALGKRSMSGYLTQSILFIVLLMPFAFGIGQDYSVTGKTLLGAGVWLVTVVLATVTEKAGRQGPFEWAHRRASYGPTTKLEARST